MRVATTLLKGKGRRPERGPFKFVELLPLQLKNQVSGKSDKTGGTSCIQEMAVMFACMKKNEFDESFCSKEITEFQTCYNAQLKLAKDAKELETQGKDAPGAAVLTHRQMNRLFEKFPQVNEPRHKLYMQ